MTGIQDAVLYGIVDLGYVDEGRAVEIGRSLLRGGVGVLQLRAKGYDPEGLFLLAVLLRELCEDADVPFIINDHVELARKCRAHGLHLGQDDGSMELAREQLEEGTIIGRSTHSPRQAELALAEGADYIGFGPLFPTPTKKGRPAIGLEEIQAVQSAVGSKIPVFCIGGIKPGNIESVLTAGARRCVVVSHLLQAESPEQAASQIVSTIKNQS